VLVAFGVAVGVALFAMLALGLCAAAAEADRQTIVVRRRRHTPDADDHTRVGRL
jgi:hypothetical protein